MRRWLLEVVKVFGERYRTAVVDAPSEEDSPKLGYAFVLFRDGLSESKVTRVASFLQVFCELTVSLVLICSNGWYP